MSRNIRVTVNIVYFQEFVIFPSLASTHDGAPLPDARGGGGLVGAAEFVRVEGSPGVERGRREKRRLGGRRSGFAGVGPPTEGQVEVICISGQVMALMRRGARGRLPCRDELCQWRVGEATILEARD